MRVLILCHKPPFPAIDGGSIAITNLIKGLVTNQVKVDVLAMNTFKQYCSSENKIEFEKEVETYSLVDVDIKIKVLDAFMNLFTSKSYNVSRFDSQKYKEKLISVLKNKKFDVVLFESLFSTPYINVVRSLHPGILVHRSHNVEFNIWQNLAQNEDKLYKKWYLNLLTKRLKKYELDVINKFDLVAAISKSDMMEYKRHGVTTSMFHLPFGIDINSSTVRELQVQNKVKIYHVGSMNWLPHQEAFHWFFDQVWANLDNLKDKLELHLAGTDMPKWMKDKSGENVFVSSGYVLGNEYAQDKEILIVPSFSGSGIRIKIIEAMASGKVILTTANGAMGIDCKHEKNILISDKPMEWVSLINELIISSDKRKIIGKQARLFCAQNHDHVQLSNLLIHKLCTTKPKLH